MFKVIHESPSRREDFETLSNTEFKKLLHLSSLPCAEKENVGVWSVILKLVDFWLAKPKKTSETNKIKFGLYYQATTKICSYHLK